MDALDPQLRGQQQKPTDPYPDLYRYPPTQSAQSPYTLNPIRQLPPPQQQNSTLPSISQDPNLPYYSAKQPEFSLNEEPQDATVQSPNAKGDGQEGQKRPRSCESCRTLKVRCERDPSMTGPCKRCAKANRNCIFTEPNHKRKKKTDNKVAELEKKIDALTASLIAVQGNNTRLSDGEEEHDENSLRTHDPLLSDAKPSRKRRRSTFERGQELASPTLLGPSVKQLAAASLNHALATPIPPLENSFQNHEYADAIDRQVLSSTTATEMFNYYRDKMAPYLPAVVIPPDTMVGDIRREKPILFLAILSVASGHKYSNIQRTLTREIMQTYADRIVNKGEKSLELIQAMQISTIWHFAEDPDDTRAFQLIQMAAAMAVAIKFTQENHHTTLDFGFRRSATQDPTEKMGSQVVKSRAWLSTFLLSGISAMNLRQQNAVHWSKFTDKAVQMLESADDAVSTDKVLCRMAKLQKISDQAIGLFFRDRPAAEISKSMADLEKQALKYGPEIEASTSYTDKLLYKILLVCFMYLRLMATSLEESNGSTPPSSQSKRDFLWKYGEPLTDSALKAGIPCMEPMQDALEIFLSVPQDELDALPSVWFNRITYIIIFLMFLTLRVISPGTGTNDAGESVSLRVGEYLTRIMDKLPNSNQDEYNPAVHKFRMVLRMFKSWFERQRDGRKHGPPKREPQDPSQLQAEPVDSERNTPRQGYRKLSVHSEPNSDNATKTSSRSPASQNKQEIPASNLQNQAAAPVAQMSNTPLKILSQVASNEPSASTQEQEQQQQPQENWYNLNEYAPQSYVPDTQAYYPNQHDFTNVNDYGMQTTYQHLPIDPELEQAMCSAFGSEGNMMGTFFNDFFSMGQGQNGMAYSNWYPTTEQ